jgi:hypothetical protein
VEHYEPNRSHKRLVFLPYWTTLVFEAQVREFAQASLAAEENEKKGKWIAVLTALLPFSEYQHKYHANSYYSDYYAGCCRQQVSISH